MTQDSDVLIVGAGPAGLALAVALADAGLRSLVLEQQPLSALEQPAEDGREIALTHRARRLMQAWGLWQRLPEEAIAPLREARVLDGEAPTTLSFGAGDRRGQEALGWLVPNHLIRAAALAAAQAHPSVQLLGEARVSALSLGSHGARLHLADGRDVSAPLVVAADSRFSGTRRLAGIGASMHDFGRSVVVGRVARSAPDDGIAWECFRYGNTLALLPLNGGLSSAVVTVDSRQAAEWLALDDAAFAARIEAQAGGRLGALQAAGPRHHYPLVAVYAHRFATHRCALIGDAAVGMHPVTAHGYNFGLYGVEALADALRQARVAGQDIGSLAALQPFERRHRMATLPIYLGTNAIVSLFTDERTLPRLVRRTVLSAAAQAPLLGGAIRGMITRQLMGQRWREAR
ncbi:5-demethoxyubiquinol-8 5-hydroxylase UbiM [Aquabacterium sp.]|uniref:5-demethoxyubiquinol-8 5-hydroxylase UbiM n=1 Tax=Aquabacterium sp. TaxID=1872578 RepID=UPI0037844B1E